MYNVEKQKVNNHKLYLVKFAEGAAAVPVHAMTCRNRVLGGMTQQNWRCKIPPVAKICTVIVCELTGVQCAKE
jgi:hypothetical protein